MSLVELREADGRGRRRQRRRDGPRRRAQEDRQAHPDRRRRRRGPAADPALLAVRAARRIADGQPEPADHRRSRARHIRGFPAPSRAGRRRWSPSISTRSKGGRVEQLAVEDGANGRQGAAARRPVQRRPAAVDPRPPDRGRAAAQQHAQPGTGAAADPQRQRARLEPGARPTSSKAQRQYELQRPLAEKGFVPGKAFNDTKDDLDLPDEAAGDPQAQHRRGRGAAGQPARRSCARRPRRSTRACRSPAAASASSTCARPVSGQLSGFSIQLGQSLQRGERLGQIDSAGRNKLVADVDEFYLGRVAVGPDRDASRSTARPIGLKVAKIYPQVRNGQFQVDLIFDGPGAAGDPARPDHADQADAGRFQPRGADPQRRLLQRHRRQLDLRRRPRRQQRRRRREVQLGRRNNDFIEVLDGLKPGERVITSSYSGLVDKDHLSFDSDQ